MTQERQDGWYWVKTPSNKWMPAYWEESEHGFAVGHGHHSVPVIAAAIGPRIPSPEDPDLLAVVKAAKMLMSSEAINDSPYVKHSYAAAALRSALARLEEK